MKVKARELVHKHIIDDLDNEALTVGKVYFVIGIEGNFYRIIDDDNEPIIYAKELFKVVDSNVPNDWITTVFDEEVCIEPLETSKPGFYEDYFDDVPAAARIYNDLLKRLGIKK